MQCHWIEYCHKIWLCLEILSLRSCISLTLLTHWELLSFCLEFVAEDRRTSMASTTTKCCDPQACIHPKITRQPANHLTGTATDPTVQHTNQASKSIEILASFSMFSHGLYQKASDKLLRVSSRSSSGSWEVSCAFYLVHWIFIKTQSWYKRWKTPEHPSL